MLQWPPLLLYRPIDVRAWQLHNGHSDWDRECWSSRWWSLGQIIGWHQHLTNYNTKRVLCTLTVSPWFGSLGLCYRNHQAEVSYQSTMCWEDHLFRSLSSGRVFNFVTMAIDTGNCAVKTFAAGSTQNNLFRNMINHIKSYKYMYVLKYTMSIP